MSERLTQVIIVEKEIHKLLPGEVSFVTPPGAWYVGCPGCNGKGNLSGHAVTIDDNLVTVSPSILCGCGAHYFIERNQIRWC